MSAHLIGVCGSGMSALASLLRDLGWSVSGSDLSAAETVSQKLRQQGVQVFDGHCPENVPRHVDVVIYSAAVPFDNPERQAARSRGIIESSYSQMLGSLMRNQQGICVAGTHGKSTTAAMLAWALSKSGYEPSACLGAELCQLGRGGWAGRGELFVVESCEYRRSFLDLAPAFSVILGVEPDHFDYFQNFADTCRAFGEFAAKCSPQGYLAVRGDCPAAVDAARKSAVRTETFSLAAGSDWRASELRVLQNSSSGTETCFRVDHRERFHSEFSLGVPGRHNVLNALAAIAICHEIGVDVSDLRKALGEFRGVRRRFEQIGTWRGIALIDDYAHHPTEVRATLQAARERFGDRRLWCVFQPHQASRTRILMNEFAESFDRADDVLIAPIYAARESTEAETVHLAQKLASRIAENGVQARFCAELDRIAATLEDEARPGDVVLCMGAGDINRVHHEFTRRLQRNLAS